MLHFCSLAVPPHQRRLTNRWEASLWLNGRQLYLGGFDSEFDAAHAYDLVALACKVVSPSFWHSFPSYASLQPSVIA